MSVDNSLSLTAGELQAVFWPEAGMLGISLRHRGTELLRRIDNLEASKAKGSTAGIPLLYPWANRLDSLRYRAAGRDVVLDPASPLLHFDERGLAIHGVPWGLLAWQIVEAKRDSLLARFDWNRPDLLTVFPFPHTLQIAASVAPDSLTLQTTVFANADSSVPVSFGFHPYLGIPQLPRAQWRVILPAMRRIVLDARGIPTGTEEPCGPFDAELGETSFDDGFAVVDTQPSFSVSGAGRPIVVTFLEGFPHAQLFAPKETDFIALEPMTAPTSALTSGKDLRVLQPGEQFRGTFRITVQSDAQEAAGPPGCPASCFLLWMPVNGAGTVTSTGDVWGVSRGVFLIMVRAASGVRELLRNQATSAH
jgi:aldose 1-epimerase